MRYLCSYKPIQNHPIMKTKLSSLLTITLLVLTTFATQARADGLGDIIERDFSPRADSLNSVLVRQFLNTARGTFWAVPRNQQNRESATTFIYWQQAHAMDVLVYAYERIKDSNPNLAANYARYMSLWYDNHANNYCHANNDPTGFYNDFTDDMCWICCTLLHIADALGEEKYAETARTVFDNYIVPRGWTDDNGFWGLPWKSDFMERNACTNGPGCVVACKLYQRYADEEYLQTAIKIYEWQTNEMKTNLNNDGRVEEPPLTYTQGTFGEACRLLYKITGDSKYLTTGVKVINYLCSSSRCTHRGLLRDEGSTMDQSIFKAVAVPYIVNMALEEDVSEAYRRTFIRFMQKNANALWNNLLLDRYPATYCNYYWGEPINTDEIPSMGAMVSGCSLMENMARLALALLPPTATTITPATPVANHKPSTVCDLSGRMVGSARTKGIQIVNGKKKIVR